MRLIWLNEAVDDLNHIVLYIARHDLDAGFRMQALVEAYAERISEHPYMHRAGRVPGTREAVVHPNYIVVYRVGADAVEIVSVIHSRQQYPPGS